MGTHPIFESDFDCLTVFRMVYAVALSKWRIGTVKRLDESKTLNEKIRKNIKIGQQEDPLPSFHDQCVLESNSGIIKYMREVRQVVMNLRSHLSAANEEIKRLSNSKMSLERCLEHLIKDIRVNQETINLRKMKPKRESEPDKADSMLNYEKEGLNAEKRVMENKIFQS